MDSGAEVAPRAKALWFHRKKRNLNKKGNKILKHAPPSKLHEQALSSFRGGSGRATVCEENSVRSGLPAVLIPPDVVPSEPRGSVGDEANSKPSPLAPSSESPADGFINAPFGTLSPTPLPSPPLIRNTALGQGSVGTDAESYLHHPLTTYGAVNAEVKS